MISSMILRMIWPYDISNLVYHSHIISWILWYSILYHSTCGAAGWGGLGAPDARRSTGSGHAIANVLGAGVQLNSDCLDPARGLVAMDAARVVTRGWLVVIEKSRLATASCAAHAGKAPMHCGSTWRGWHLGLKYGLGVQYGFKLETGWVKEEGEAGDYLYSHQYLNYWTPSPNWTWPIAWQRSHPLVS